MNYHDFEIRWNESSDAVRSNILKGMGYFVGNEWIYLNVVKKDFQNIDQNFKTEFIEQIKSIYSRMPMIKGSI